MKSKKSVLMIGIVSFMMISLVCVNSSFAKGPGHGHGLFKMLSQLNLSDDQKAQVSEILKKYKDEKSALRETMQTAREKFMTTLQDEPFDELTVRQAFQEMVPAMEDMAVFRAKVFSDIKAVLTAEQLELLRQKREEMKAKIKAHQEFRDSMAQFWLQPETE